MHGNTDWRRSMSDILATDLIRALWDDARREGDPERKAQLERDAMALEDVWRRSPYALAATKDQMTAALGNASLNIADSLGRLDVRVGEIHQHVQESNTLISAFVESFSPQFAAFQQEMRTAVEETARGQKKDRDDIAALQEGQAIHALRLDEIGTIEAWRTDVDARLAKIEQSDRDDLRAKMEHIEQRITQYEEEHRVLLERLGSDAG